MRPILDEVFKRILDLSRDQFGNYVISHVLEHGRELERSVVINKVKRRVLSLCLHKYGSNVIEKCLVHGNDSEREEIMNEIVNA